MALTRLNNNAIGETITAAKGGTGVTSADNIGNLVLLSTATASSGDQYITFDLSSSYDNYIIKGHSIKPATDGVEPYMGMSTDGGSNYSTDSFYSGRSYVKVTTSTASGAERGTISGAVRFATDLGNDGEGSCTINLYGMNNSSNKFGDTTWTAKHQADDYTWDTGFILTSNSAINNIRLYFSSGNYTSGTFSLYGVKS